MVDCEPDQDATNEELDVSYKAFAGSSLDSVDVQLPIHVDVVRTVECSYVTEAVLREKEPKDELCASTF